MLRVIERTERILDRRWLEDRKALSLLNDIDPSTLQDERRLYYRIFEVFSRDTVAPDAIVLCLDHGYMLEVINMVRALDAQLTSLADSLLRAAGRNYAMHFTRSEGDEYARMGFCCETINYRKINTSVPSHDEDFCGDVSSLFDSKKAFLDWVRMLYGTSSIYSTLVMGGRMMSWRSSNSYKLTVLSHRGQRWVIGGWFTAEGVVALTREEFGLLMQCIQSELPVGDELIYTYHQYTGGPAAMWLLENGWLPESYVYGRTLKTSNGEDNAN